MRRGGSAKAPDKAAAARGHQLLSEILNWRHEYPLVAALLGPPGAGKTALLEKASAEARLRKFHVESVDLSEARELSEVDDFYTWLVRKLKEDWWRDIPNNGPARLGFNRMLGQALIQRRQPVLLALDHVESLPEAFAHHLISDLREIQDSAQPGGMWGRLRYVIAGSVSVYELRRRVNSPNLQFRLHVLPVADSAEAGEMTRCHLRETERSADDATIGFLAQETGGEPAFLNALDDHLLRPQIDLADAEAAISSMLRNACQYRHLSIPAYLYLLDQPFREKADRMLDGSPVALPPPTDIDRYQLAGAWIAARGIRSQPCFRNGLIERVLRGVRDYSGDGNIDQGLTKISRLQRFALGALEIPRLLECVEDAWRGLMRMDARAQLLIGKRNTGFSIDAASVSHIEMPESHGAEGNGHQAHSLIKRCVEGCVVDTHWPDADESLVLRMCPDQPFSSSVAVREMLRLWSLFLQPLDKVCLQLALLALGRHTLRTGLPKKVFVSSTCRDLPDHRRAVLEMLVRRDLLFRGMEYFGAEPESRAPAEKIIREVREADVYLGIFGMSYGSVDLKSGLSFTELEFNEAESSGKPMLLYVIRDDADVKANVFNSETEANRKALIARVKKHTPYLFGTKEDLARQVYEDLGKL